MEKYIRFVLCIVIYTVGAVMAGAMLNFIFPFNDPVESTVAFCTVVICTVMAVCTCVIIHAVRAGKED